MPPLVTLQAASRELAAGSLYLMPELLPSTQQCGDPTVFGTSFHSITRYSVIVSAAAAPALHCQLALHRTSPAAAQWRRPAAAAEHCKERQQQQHYGIMVGES
jgi:hypothetical protein